MDKPRALRYRIAPLEMSPGEFRKAGYRLIDQVAELLCTLPERPVAPNEAPTTVRALLGSHSLPEQGCDASSLLDEAIELLFEHPVFNGHPRFMGFITSSAAPIGALGDLLAAAVNPNVGSSLLAPMASEIEAQVVRWIAEMIGYPSDCGGLLVSPSQSAGSPSIKRFGWIRLSCAQRFKRIAKLVIYRSLSLGRQGPSAQGQLIRFLNWPPSAGSMTSGFISMERMGPWLLFSWTTKSVRFHLI